MPLPTEITWYRAESSATHFPLQDPSRQRNFTVPLVECHQEIIDRPDPPAIYEGLTCSYRHKRHTWIQERILALYLDSIRAGMTGTGYLYGVFQEDRRIQEVDRIPLYDGRLFYLNEGPSYMVLRLGLIYSYSSLSSPDQPVPAASLEAHHLPRLMLPNLENREAFDEGKPFPEVPNPVALQSRYHRSPVI